MMADASQPGQAHLARQKTLENPLFSVPYSLDFNLIGSGAPGFL